ncbi:MAG: hypothetical protein ABFD25_03260 [Clostridiaceae bacterium]
MGIITTDMIDATTAAVSEFWDQGMAQKVDFKAKLYNEKPTDLLQENFQGIGAIGQMSDWKGTVDYQQFNLGFNKGFVQAKKSTGLQFDERVFRYREYSQLEEKTGLLLDSVYNTQQAYGAATFENAFTAAYVGPDNVSLCNTSHPNSPSDAAVQSNVGALDLTMPNLLTTFKKMSQLKDDKDNLLFLQPNMLITGIEYWDVAKKICGPDANGKEPGTADNDPNLMQKELTYFYHPFITGKKWFLVDSQRMKRRLKWFNGRIPTPEHQNDFDTEAIKYKIVGEWVAGWTSWEWVYGNIA